MQATAVLTCKQQQNHLPLFEDWKVSPSYQPVIWGSLVRIGQGAKLLLEKRRARTFAKFYENFIPLQVGFLIGHRNWILLLAKPTLSIASLRSWASKFFSGPGSTQPDILSWIPPRPWILARPAGHPPPLAIGVNVVKCLSSWIERHGTIDIWGMII